MGNGNKMQKLPRMPQKCVHPANMTWHCIICIWTTSNPLKSHMPLPVTHAVAYHTMEMCASAFVGASTKDIDFTLLYFINIGNTSLAVINWYADMDAPLRHALRLGIGYRLFI